MYDYIFVVILFSDRSREDQGIPTILVCYLAASQVQRKESETCINWRYLLWYSTERGLSYLSAAD